MGEMLRIDKGWELVGTRGDNGGMTGNSGEFQRAHSEMTKK